MARVWIKPGSGKVTVNGKDQDVYFARPVLQLILRQPFQVAGVEGEFDVVATVNGQARHLEGAATVRTRPARAAESRRLPDPRLARGGTEEIR